MKLPLIQALKSLGLISSDSVGCFRKETPTLQGGLSNGQNQKWREGPKEWRDLNIASVLADVRVKEAAKFVGLSRSAAGENLVECESSVR